MSNDEESLGELGLPPEISLVLKKHLLEIRQFNDTILRLEADLAAFNNRLKEASATNQFIDKGLAADLQTKSIELLQLCKDHPGADFVAYVLAAIHYFIAEDDASPDFDGIDGFEDDAEVLENVIQHFNLNKLLQTYRKGA